MKLFFEPDHGPCDQSLGNKCREQTQFVWNDDCCSVLKTHCTGNVPNAFKSNQLQNADVEE